MNNVKAKFRCHSIIDKRTNYAGDTTINQRNVEFSAVYGAKGENASYSAATPSGTLIMVINPGTDAFNAFEPGKDYYLTIEPAGPAADETTS